jgi:transcriptional/translational regulatory protein YebC/TACO1
MEILTDNRHRTAADVRMVMEKYGGNLGASGAVAWMFERRGRFVLDPTLPMGARSHDTPPPWTDERLLELALAIGADDFTRAHGDVVLGCRPTDFAAVASALVARAIPLREAVLAYAATQRVLVDDAALAGRFQDMVEALEDHDDVQTVFSNVEFGAAAQPPRHAPGA